MSFGQYILDKDGNPERCEDIIKWGMWIAERNNKVVQQDHVDDIFVSTVFLGLDHNWLDNGPPILFETMVFNKDRNELHCARYCTKTEAIEGHMAVMARVLNGEIKDEL